MFLLSTQVKMNVSLHKKRYYKKYYPDYFTIIYITLVYHHKHRNNPFPYLSIWLMVTKRAFYVLFVCLGFFVPLVSFSLIRHYQWKAAIVDICPLLMAIALWGFFSVSHLLWQVTSFYNGNFRWYVTSTPNSERLSVDLATSD